MRWTRSELNAWGGEIRTEGQLGRISFLQSELYQPLTVKRRAFLAVSGLWEYGRHPFSYELKEWGNYNVEKLEIAPEVGLRLGHFGEVRVGLVYGGGRASDRTSLSLAEFDGARGGYTARLGFDMVNRAVLPYLGWGGRATYFRARPQFGSGLDYHRLSGGLGLALGNPADLVNLAVRGGTDFRSNLPLYEVFTLGGLGQISGLQEDQLSGEVFGLARASYYHRISGATSPYAPSWYVGLQVEAGNAWFWFENRGLDTVRFAGLVSLVGTTFAGPLSLAYGRTDDGHDTVYLSLGLINRFLD
jgi:NTE family protein